MCIVIKKLLIFLFFNTNVIAYCKDWIIAMSNNTHVIDHPHQDEESDGTESFYSYVKDDSLNTDVAEDLLIDTSAKRRKIRKKGQSSKEQKNNRREANRQSAQRSRKRQKILEISLEERIAKLQGDKSNLETRFKNGIKEIFKLWPLPDRIPEEFSSLGPLLNLIDQVSLYYECIILLAKIFLLA